jgi:acetate kinase
VRRYGFHGPSHLYLSRRGAVLLGKPAAACNLVTIHMDRGVSLCAIREGCSVDTSMGLTPLEGAVMGTRCGDIDPGIPAFIMQAEELSARELESVLNQKCGIFGLTGRHRDRRHLLDAALDGDVPCRRALELEAYRLKKYLGAYLAAVGPLDGVVFTAGTGGLEWLARELTLDGLECFGIRLDRERNRTVCPDKEEVITTADSAVQVFVVPGDDGLVSAEDTAAILAGDYSDHLRHDYRFARAGFVPPPSRREAVPENRPY